MGRKGAKHPGTLLGSSEAKANDVRIKCTSKTATKSSSSPHSILKRLSTTNARDLLFHLTVKFDLLAPGFKRSITC